MLNKNNTAIGNVERELGFGLVCFGERKLGWRRKHFSRFRMEPHRWVNPHTVIVGGSGGGKSNACKMIVKALCAQDANVAILDSHSEYMGLCSDIGAKVYDASRNGINIFDLDGMSEREKASEITGMLKRNFRLGEVQGYMLYKCIMYAYTALLNEGKTPNIHNLMFAIKAFKRNSKTASERSVLESLERRMSLIANGAFEKNADISRVISSNSVFVLSRLHTPEAQSIYIEGFLRKAYSKMLSMEKAGRPRFYIVIDEAEKLGDNPILGKIAAEGRKYGIGIIAISQRAKLMDRDLRANAAMLISFGIKEPEELNYVANFISGGNEAGRFIEVKKALRNLGRGKALVTRPDLRNPILVSFYRNESGGESAEFKISELARGGIMKEELLKTLGAQGETMKAIEGMVADGSLKKEEVLCGKYSGTWYISDSHNSAEHDVNVGIVSRHLISLGIRNRVYNSAYGPDIIVFYGGERIAVEYETGSKDLESSVKMIEGRAPRYKKTVVVVNDAAAGRYAERVGNVVRFSCVESDLREALLG